MNSATLPNFRSLTQLLDKTVVVFGGSSGIGYAVAKASLEHGAKVIIASSNAEKVAAAVKSLEEMHESFQGRISGSACNVRDEAEVHRFWDGVGSFDHLVYAAGDVMQTSFDEPIETARQHFDVPFFGALISARYTFKKGYINAGGSITMTIGSSFRRPYKELVMVTAVTGAIDGVTRGLAVQLAPIRVNTVAPGYVDTPFWRNLDPKWKDALYRGVEQTSLVRHVATADEVADAYLFCMKCTNLTGITLDVEGGQLLAPAMTDPWASS